MVVIRPSTKSDLSSETAWSIVTDFHLEPSGIEVKKISSNCPGHRINMAAMPVYGRILLNFLPQNQLTNDFECI